MADGDLLLTGVGELVTNDPDRGGPLGVVHDAAVAVEDGRIAWAGPQRELPGTHRGREEIDCGGRAVLPGFVDAHTHLVFAGDRADEFARRLRGERYEDLLASGGGIMRTVRATRAASRGELHRTARHRARRLLAAGITTAEAKSGYGLDTVTERRMLEVVADLDAELAIDLVPTWLGAHLVPPGQAEDRTGFLRMLIEESLPACAPLAEFADAFCDEGALTLDESRRVLAAAAEAGLSLRLHADELAHSGGARLAADLSCVSADHLAHADASDARALAAAGTVAVLLPATTFSLGSDHYADGAMLWREGVRVALGTDLNPGTSYTESMAFVIALACHHCGLTPEQAVWAATRGGALALRRRDRGLLTAGALADLLVLDAPSYLHLPYRPTGGLVRQVVKRGVPVT